MVNEILYELVNSGIISETKEDEDKDVAYQPARDIEAFTVKNVIDMLERRGSDDIPVAQSKELDKLSDCLESFSDVIEKLPANMALKDV